MTRIFDNLRKQDRRKPVSMLKPVSGWSPSPLKTLMSEDTWNRLLEDAEMLRPLEPYFCPKAD